MTGLSKDDRSDKWHKILNAAHACVHSEGCVAVLCDEGQTDKVKGIVKDKLGLHLHQAIH